MPAAAQCENCSSAVLAGNQNLNFTHKIGGKKTIRGRETNLISNNYTLISGQLGQSVDISRISPGNTNNIKLRYNPQKSQVKCWQLQLYCYTRFCCLTVDCCLTKCIALVKNKTHNSELFFKSIRVNFTNRSANTPHHLRLVSLAVLPTQFLLLRWELVPKTVI